MKSVWIVLDNDYDSTWVVAVYPTEQMATDHVAEMDGYITEAEVLETLHPDVADPVKQQEREQEKAKQRKEWEAHQARQAANQRLVQAQRPNPPRMSLCHCQTFSSDNWFVTEHGYCGYCGGWRPNVFRKHMGELALQSEIDKLAVHHREKMRLIVAQESA